MNTRLKIFNIIFPEQKNVFLFVKTNLLNDNDTYETKLNKSLEVSGKYIH